MFHFSFMKFQELRYYYVYMKLKHKNFRYFSGTLLTAIGLVLVWRGIWYVLDAVDTYFFDGYNLWTAIGGIILGIIVLYIPDHDLKELQKL